MGWDEMDPEQIAAIAALKEPARRALYRYVAQQADEVSRDQAARATGLSRVLAAFHLDRLVKAGLLVSTFRRLSDRKGPGGGRPSKLYRRAPRDIRVNVPERRYDLLARVLATAIEKADGEAGARALTDAAGEFGVSLGARARRQAGATGDRAAMLAGAERELASCGFEPRLSDDVVRLRNCPFDALVQDHRDLVCATNLALVRGLLTGLGAQALEAHLDPQPGHCCVALRLTPQPG